jgi:hypothetical protein
MVIMIISSKLNEEEIWEEIMTLHRIARKKNWDNLIEEVIFSEEKIVKLNIWTLSKNVKEGKKEFKKKRRRNSERRGNEDKFWKSIQITGSKDEPSEFMNPVETSKSTRIRTICFQYSIYLAKPVSLIDSRMKVKSKGSFLWKSIFFGSREIF